MDQSAEVENMTTSRKVVYLKHTAEDGKSRKLFWLQNSEEQRDYSISRYVNWHKAHNSGERKFSPL